jgi:hypothetical protein
MNLVLAFGKVLYNGPFFAGLLILSLLLLSITIGVIGLNYSFFKSVKNIKGLIA